MHIKWSEQLASWVRLVPLQNGVVWQDVAAATKWMSRPTKERSDAGEQQVASGDDGISLVGKADDLGAKRIAGNSGQFGGGQHDGLALYGEGRVEDAGGTTKRLSVYERGDHHRVQFGEQIVLKYEQIGYPARGGCVRVAMYRELRHQKRRI